MSGKKGGHPLHFGTHVRNVDLPTGRSVGAIPIPPRRATKTKKGPTKKGRKRN